MKYLIITILLIILTGGCCPKEDPTKEEMLPEVEYAVVEVINGK